MEERSTMNLSTNLTRMSHYLPEGVILIGLSRFNENDENDQRFEELSR